MNVNFKSDLKACIGLLVMCVVAIAGCIIAEVAVHGFHKVIDNGLLWIVAGLGAGTSVGLSVYSILQVPKGGADNEYINGAWIAAVITCLWILSFAAGAQGRIG